MIIEGIDKTWTSISIHKYKGRDAYYFSSKELNDLCGGEFSSRNIEIEVVVEQTMRFTLSRLTTKLRLHFNVLFPTEEEIQMFFREIRHEQRSVIIPVYFSFTHSGIESTKIIVC